MPEMIPTVKQFQIGYEIVHNGKKLKAVQEFKQGKEAKVSGFKYFMHTSRGMLGLKEVA